MDLYETIIHGDKFDEIHLKKYVVDANVDEICKTILKAVQSSEEYKIRILDSILQSFTDSDKLRNKKKCLIVCLFDTVTKKSKLSKNDVHNIINRIALECSLFDKNYLIEFVDYFVERIQNHNDDFMSWKDVLPLLLEKLVEEKSLNYKGSEISGKDYKNIIINNICDIKWHATVITPLAKMFVDLVGESSNKSICARVLQAMIYQLEVAYCNEIPAIVYQMLKIGSICNDITLFSNLAKYFKNKYDKISNLDALEEMSELSITPVQITSKELKEIESTVLYYIYQSALDNEKSLLDYIQCLKNLIHAPEYILDSFVMSLLLLSSNLYRNQPFNILKLVLFQQVLQRNYQNNNAWLRKISLHETSALEIINQIIDSSGEDRQLVVKGMVDFAFFLLDTDCKSQKDNNFLWDYGRHIVQRVTRKKDDICGSILEKLVHRIIQGDSNIIQYADCLKYMCGKLTIIVLQYQTWITTLLDQLLILPDDSSIHIILAILPLIRISSLIRDNIVIILRKALYHKGIHTRRMAVLGFMIILKNLKLSTLSAFSQSHSLSSQNITSSSSILTQAIMERSTQGVLDPWHNTSLCREILAILSKCFTQEIEVRSHLYKEIYYAVVTNKNLAEYIVDILMEHIDEFCGDNGQILIPLNFSKCFLIQGIEIILQEPIAELLFTLQKLYVLIASRNSSTIDRLANILEALCKYMSETTLDQLLTDNDIESADSKLQLQSKVLQIKINILICESLISYKIACWSKESIDNGKTIVSMLTLHHNLMQHLKNSCKVGKVVSKSRKTKDCSLKNKDDVTQKIFEQPNTIIDLDTINKSISLLYKPDHIWGTEEQTSVIRGSTEFHLYILQSCKHILGNIKILKTCELKSYLKINKINLFSIGSILFQYLFPNIKSVNSLDQEIIDSGIACFKECYEIVNSYYEAELPAFLELTCGIPSHSGLFEQLQEFIVKLKDFFTSSLTYYQSDDIVSQQISLGLIEIYSKIIKKIDFKNITFDKELEWLKSITKVEECINDHIRSTIIQQIFFIEDKNFEYSETIQDLCNEFGYRFGKTDKSIVPENEKFKLKIFNETDIYTVFNAVNNALSTSLQKLNWLLNRLNAENLAMITLHISNQSSQRIKDAEESLCRQFLYILGVFEILSRVKVTPGQSSESLFKNLHKVYNFASSLVKYFRKNSTKLKPAFESTKLIPVIQGAGTVLKQAVTELILHVEGSQHGGKSKDTNIQKNKILKEIMVIPSVVQAIDMFDKEIALLAKKTNIDVLKYTKYGAIRDFRIQNYQLKENLDKLNSSLLITQVQPGDNDAVEVNNYDSISE